MHVLQKKYGSLSIITIRNRNPIDNIDKKCYLILKSMTKIIVLSKNISYAKNINSK